MGIKKSIFIALIFVVVIGLVAFLMKPAPAPPRIFPNPNGYDDIIKAIQLLPAQTMDFEKLSKADLEDAYAPALKLAREGLQKECLVSDAHALDVPNNTHIAHLGPIKSLAQCFIARGDVAKAEMRYRDAVVDYLEAIRLGAKGLRGGVLIDRLVGCACEHAGVKALKKALPDLPAAECRDFLTALEEIEQQRDSIEKTLAYEREYVSENSTLSQRLSALVMFRSQQRMMEKFRIKIDGVTLFERQLQLECAARAFELEKGKKPTSAQELVPTYLKAIPQDPTTKTNLSL